MNFGLGHTSISLILRDDVFLRAWKASPGPRRNCLENCFCMGVSISYFSFASELGNVCVFFLDQSWLCVPEGDVTVALWVPRSRPGLPPCLQSQPAYAQPNPPHLWPACLAPPAGRNQSRLAWRRTLQEQLPANGNYFKTNWCGFSVKPTWRINKVGL